MQKFKKLLINASLASALLANSALAELDMKNGDDAIKITLESLYKITYGLASNKTGFKTREFIEAGRLRKSYDITTHVSRESEGGQEYGIVFKVAPNSNKKNISELEFGGDAPSYQGAAGVITKISKPGATNADPSVVIFDGTTVNDKTIEEDKEITISVANINDIEGTSKLKGVVELEVPLVKSVYLYIKQDKEKMSWAFEAGRVSTVSKKMNFDAGDISYGSGGIRGHWRYYANLSGDRNLKFTGGPMKDSKDRTSFISRTGSYSDIFSENDFSLSTNFMFRSKELGTKLGLSYTPNQGDLTTDKLSGDLRNYRDVFSFAFNHEIDLSIGNVLFSAVKEIGHHENDYEFKGLKSFVLGVMFRSDCGSIALSGSYGNLGESGMKKEFSTNDTTEYWVFGASHDAGLYAYSVSYMRSFAAQNDNYAGVAVLDNVIASMEYRSAQGLIPFVELSLFSTTDATVDTKHTQNNLLPANNSGGVLMVGSKLTF